MADGPGFLEHGEVPAGEPRADRLEVSTADV